MTLKMMLEVGHWNRGRSRLIARLDEAIEAAKVERLDLALLDVTIIGAAKCFLSPISSRIPIIFHTGHGLKEDLTGTYRSARSRVTMPFCATR